jgi:low affinity Fe/Cu permease
MVTNGTRRFRFRYRRPPHSGVGRALERASQAVSHWAGSSWAFALAALVIVVWLVTGPLFRFSDTWQLVINTGTTVVTFLMVFLIQRAQNKDALAIQLKLNEIVAAIHGASNRLIAVEELSEPELQALHAHYCRLADMAKRDADLLRSHSIEEAEQRHRRKHAATPAEPPASSSPAPAGTAAPRAR